MRSLRLVFLNELQILIRSRVFVISLLFFIILSGYAIYYGNSVIREQQSVIEKFQQESESRFQKLKSSIDKDTLANVVGNRLFRPVINHPSSLASFSIGQRDILPFYGNIRYWALSRQNLVVEPSNPEKLLSGNFDLAFIFIQLMPLFIIGLSYNLLSGEKESGTLSMVLSYPITDQQLLIYKLVTRFVIISITSLMVIFAGSIYCRVKFDLNYLAWVSIILGYTIFWFFMMYLLNITGKSSAFNALASLCIWLLLVLLFPSGTNIYVGIKIPSISKQELSHKIREEYELIWEKYDDPIHRYQVSNAFGKKYPAYKSDTIYNWSDKYMLAQYDNYDNKLQPLLEKHQNDAIEREELTLAIGRFNPVVSAQIYMNRLAKTDLTSHIEFQQLVKLFHSELKNYFYKKVFTNSNITPQELDKIPSFNNNSHSSSVN
jgi:ABC-2 type transport system permease protein